MEADKKILNELVRRIVDAVRPLRIILFGSAARGEMGPDSDLDVLVVVPDGTHRRKTAPLLSAASNTGIPVPENPQEVAGLTIYAGELRYPGNYEAATEDDHRRAVEIAARGMAWAEDIVSGK